MYVVAAQGHICICGPAEAGFCVYVCNLCLFRGSKEQCSIKSEGYAEPALPFASPGIADPAPHLAQQQESWP